MQICIESKKAIEELLKTESKTLKDFASDLGMEYVHVTRILNGERSVTQRFIESFAEAYGEEAFSIITRYGLGNDLKTMALFKQKMEKNSAFAKMEQLLSGVFSINFTHQYTIGNLVYSYNKREGYVKYEHDDEGTTTTYFTERELNKMVRENKKWVHYDVVMEDSSGTRRLSEEEYNEYMKHLVNSLFYEIEKTKFLSENAFIKEI